MTDDNNTETGKGTECVIFDFGGVVFTSYDKTAFEKAMEPLVSRAGLPNTQAMRTRVYQGPEFQKAKVGGMTSVEMFSAIFASYGITDPEEVLTFRKAVRLVGRRVEPTLLEFISELKMKGIRIALLSNYESDLLEVLDELNVRHVFEPHIFNSYDLRTAKPSLDCFAKALAALNIVDCDRVVFIDDKPKNVAAGVTAGIRNSILYTSLEQCIRDVSLIVSSSSLPPPSSSSS